MWWWNWKLVGRGKAGLGYSLHYKFCSAPQYMIREANFIYEDHVNNTGVKQLKIHTCLLNHNLKPTFNLYNLWLDENIWSMEYGTLVRFQLWAQISKLIMTLHGSRLMLTTAVKSKTWTRTELASIWAFLVLPSINMIQFKSCIFTIVTKFF